MDQPVKSWHPLSKGLHWLIAILILCAWGSVELHESFSKGDPMRGWLMVFHFSAGFTVLLLVFLRMYGRATHPRPKLYGSAWQRPVSVLVESLLYVAMLGMPLTGLAMRQFAGRDTTLFWLFDLPSFVEKNKDVAKQLSFLHQELIWNSLLALLVLHISGALWHHFVTKDATLRHMLPWVKSN
ncbi:cytochrome b [Microbulbifer hainanensis]|uniref:cytochrome b n=1 Tax=Microbulbifer hainanensis TaxID=2735675 RepID=UPI001867A06E|nr:cytochrome b [Microbulbifer hainanensis]